MIHISRSDHASSRRLPPPSRRIDAGDAMQLHASAACGEGAGLPRVGMRRRRTSGTKPTIRRVTEAASTSGRIVTYWWHSRPLFRSTPSKVSAETSCSRRNYMISTHGRTAPIDLSNNSAHPCCAQFTVVGKWKLKLFEGAALPNVPSLRDESK
jgi:hypothetical protein